MNDIIVKKLLWFIFSYVLGIESALFLYVLMGM